MVNTFEKECRSIQPPTQMSFVTASVTTLLIFTNVPGNILVILAVVLDPNKNLRTPFNWLLVNLAVADLIVGVIAQPLAVYFHIKEGLDNNGVNSEESLAIHIIYFISCTASILSVSSLAVERYLAVRTPYTYRSKVTNKRIVLTIVIIWLISFSLPNINLNVGFSTYAFIYANTSIAVGVIIIGITYTLMKRKLGVSKMICCSGRCVADPTGSEEEPNAPSQHESSSVIFRKSANYPNTITQNIEWFRETAPSTLAEASNSPSHVRNQLPTVHTNVSSLNAITHSRQLVEAKVTKVFLTVLIALVSFYGPSTIMMYVVSFCDDCSCDTRHCLEDISVLFTFMNSSINFFCYALRCSRFRNSFVKLLKINRR